MGIWGKRTGESGNHSAIRTHQSGSGSNPATGDSPPAGWFGTPGPRGASVRAMSGLRRYREILSVPYVTPLLLASMLARLPYGVYALAAILYLSAERDS